MGSAGSPNTWTPYDSYKDCAQGLCNIYCPQWCSDPPPDPGDDSGTTFSPLIISVIGILASAFLLVSYYAIITKYCRRRRPRNPNIEVRAHHDEVTQDQWQVASAGLDEALINSITVFKYKKADRLVEGMECSVCLNEFQENENLRLLPKCCHAFHPPCIDVWLKSHTNCPLCRANAAPTYALPVPSSAAQASSAVNISALESQPQHDLIFVVEGTQRSHNEESFVTSVSNPLPKSPLQSNCVVVNSDTRIDNSLGDQERERQVRRSISLGTFPSKCSLLVADILKIEEDEEDLRNVICQSDTGIGSSEGIQTEESKINNIARNQELFRTPAVQTEVSELNNIARNQELFRTPATVKRSFSTGRFYFHKESY